MNNVRSLVSVNQTNTLVFHFSEPTLTCSSLVTNQITYFTIEIPDILQIVPLYTSNIIFIRTTNTFIVWCLDKGTEIKKIIMSGIQDICVSRKYIALCTSHEIQLIYTSSLQPFQTFCLDYPYLKGTSVLDHYENHTIFVYSAKKGECTICRENKMATIKICNAMVTSLFVDSKSDLLVVVCSKEIMLFKLSSLQMVRKVLNSLLSVDVCSFSSTMCFCSNGCGKTLCIGLNPTSKVFFIDHRSGYYLYSQNLLYNVDASGRVLRRILVE